MSLQFPVPKMSLPGSSSLSVLFTPRLQFNSCFFSVIKENGGVSLFCILCLHKPGTVVCLLGSYYIIFSYADIKVLEDEFDELIVDVATKRRQYPRRILESVIKTLKAQHESLKQYRPVVHPLDLRCDPDPASHVENLKSRGDAIAKKISDAMKALPALIEQGDSFSQVLKMQPVIQLQRINQEVFSSCYRSSDTKPDKSVDQIETTPTETAARKASNIVLKRKHAPSDRSQRKCYPLRLKRINLDG
ncbi:kinetochore-associated protein NSL1 homolog isoform X2 [Arvicola amphibius]|uniref:kinetochore-associated protein NSL1 homolog isoform X2 n=1 Tax=Arvicola amphibius TaxID=1047088 RepID=UPI0018E38FAC|nr:kinetochore-associated protein NSL1 homolog isoform X2 [Arvicola amphibius]